MSVSTANELVQELHNLLSKRWKGQINNFSSMDAYKYCKKIVMEAEEELGEIAIDSET